MEEVDLFGNKIPPEAKYKLTDGTSITASALHEADREIQIEAMRNWFGEHFEDPINLPYNGREGGYQFIHGGPYEPRSELQDKLGGIVSEDALEELADELEDIAFEWSGRSDRDLDDYLFESIIQFPDHYA